MWRGWIAASRHVDFIVTVQNEFGSHPPVCVFHVSHADGGTERISVRAVVAGDTLQIPKGGVIPVDSTLASGVALVDESLVTGESRPEKRAAGEALLGGSLSVDGAIRVIAQRDVATSTLASVVALLERAQGTRPQIARAADRVANWFVSATLLLALAVVAAWMVYDPSRAFPAALAVLVVTCPCALSLATPVAVAAASTRLARRGLLITRADALERLAGIDTVVLDKTGTLTAAGRLSITGMTMLGSLDKKAALATAAALERSSSHPLAALFTRYDEPEIAVTDLRELDGRGVEARIAGTRWRIGRHDFVAELAADTAAPPGDLGIYLGSENGLAALFELGEILRPDAVVAIERLRALGVEPIIASGDWGEAVDPARTRRVRRHLGAGAIHDQCHGVLRAGDAGRPCRLRRAIRRVARPLAQRRRWPSKRFHKKQFFAWDLVCSATEPKVTTPANVPVRTNRRIDLIRLTDCPSNEVCN